MADLEEKAVSEQERQLLNALSELEHEQPREWQVNVMLAPLSEIAAANVILAIQDLVVGFACGAVITCDHWKENDCGYQRTRPDAA